MSSSYSTSVLMSDSIAPACLQGLSIALETLEAKFDHELNISFNSKYLIDVASKIDGEKILFYLNDTGSPALIKDPVDKDSIFVIMPMKA